MAYDVKKEIKEMENYFFCDNGNTESHIISRARMRHYMNIQKTKSARKCVSVIIRKTKYPSIKKRLEANTTIGMVDTVKMRRQKIQNYYPQGRNCRDYSQLYHTQLTDFQENTWSNDFRLFDKSKISSQQYLDYCFIE